MGIESNGERQAPKTIESAEPSHLARYQFATQFINKDQVVLDAPCGSGYGSALMAQQANHVVGIDINRGAIEHANEFFAAPNITFQQSDAEHMASAVPQKNGFDIIVSFEGIEHMQNPNAFLAEVAKLLSPEGRFIVSTPRKPHGSPYHTIEFSLEEFQQILSEYFEIEAVYGQIYTDIFDMKERREDPAAYEHFNFIAVCKPKKQNGKN